MPIRLRRILTKGYLFLSHKGHPRKTAAARPFLLDLAELGEHTPHLLELLEELVDFLDGGSTAAGDAAAAAAVEEVRVPALLASHRLDDRLEPVQLFLIHL